MTHLPFFNPALHQTLTIEHLKYQNELLLKRNQMLATENQKLLQELQIAMEKVTSQEMQEAHRVTEQQKTVLQKAKSDCASLFSQLDKKEKGIIGKQVAVYKDALNRDSSINQIYDGLIKIISSLMEGLSQQKQIKLRGMIDTAEERLLRRKVARDSTEKVVHLIREPPKQMHLSLSELREYGRLQADLYQRIIRKTKRSTFNIHCLQQIYQQIDQLLSLRCKMKQEERRVVILQRQLQIGKLNPFNNQSTNSLLPSLSEQIKQLKQKIQINLQGLK